MIVSPSFCAMMARYNMWQNASLVTAADQLNEGARVADRGAFFGSIMGTFSHLLWADTIWMSRFDGWDAPVGGIPGSAALHPDWTAFKSTRTRADRRILGWADRLDTDDLEGELSWHSGALGRDVSRPYAMCIAHFFNHQTHHRGQIHAMLTAAGAGPGDTDLFVMPEDIGF
ncbi:DinB family protein [Roseovarius pelagicus]|uniref:Damage-inducible protein DinB n=1 Tax=Roseovarius pelagicus TaxID=2980108 RepID=A0ABY6DDH1_9RHOB|nr:DinB family protein [Roseovarius pelagicus]UXX84196.1 damage-inducible protein DinB [Roseovarius pelagicus]